ncbi:quaternary amine ABC transporter ATP-binding protein [Streptomyces yerevanensis]|uniref:quaternary amine ABC transporter ATP-binding protein n=1 Tax=Streptomyces yerevanensis TaxID=66378 RepID=UPI001B8017C0|nr:betaine/proline/choline family ABC transporter ATP-binding protein [Streptomyces yerevanensis]
MSPGLPTAQSPAPPTEATTAMIEGSGLSKVYGLSEPRAAALLQGAHPAPSIAAAGGNLAVHDVAFTVDQGELFVIMGLSGSGKSTLLRMVNRLVEPSSGTVHIDGADVTGMEPAALRELRNRHISMVFQHFALLPHRTVRENAAYGLQIRQLPVRERLERADAALHQVGLGDRGDVRPHQLSGGMRQRVGLARALATDADILLMDEPFSALDPLIRRDMQDLLLRLQAERRRTIVFVTHDLNEAMRIGGRIMVMKDGRVVQCGTGPEILSSPADAYVSDFVSDVDRSRVLTAGAVMRPALLTATVDEAPAAVLDRLANAEANGVFVLGDDGRLLGVARDEDLAAALRDGEPDIAGRVADTFDVVPPDLPLSDLLHLAGRNVVPVTVVEDGRLLGVVPRAAILSAIAMPGRSGRA